MRGKKSGKRINLSLGLGEAADLKKALQKALHFRGVLTATDKEALAMARAILVLYSALEDGSEPLNITTPWQVAEVDGPPFIFHKPRASGKSLAPNYLIQSRAGFTTMADVKSAMESIKGLDLGEVEMAVLSGWHPDDFDILGAIRSASRSGKVMFVPTDEFDEEAG